MSMSSKSAVHRSSPTKRSDNRQRPQPVQRQALGGSSAPNPAEMQKRHGNQGTQAWLAGLQVQTKLTVGQPGDKYEQEADRTADTVMRMPDPMKPGDDGTKVQTKPLAGEQQQIRAGQTASNPDSPHIQRLCTECEKELGGQSEKKQVQTKEHNDQTPQVTPDIEANIAALNGNGSPLPNSTRNYFELRFGADFSQVRVHTGTQAAETAKSLNAKAFTVGNNIIFGRGQFTPNSHEGKRLIGHELTHVVQQGKALQRLFVQRHAGVDHSRTKPRLESAELSESPGLQRAASSAEFALEVNKSTGPDVSRLQNVLSKLGYATAVTSEYDRATQASVAQFQSDHGIPWPTGRQAGPKTLSTMDDHLLNKQPVPPKPKGNCKEYGWKERKDSFGTKGRSIRYGSFGQELWIYNYAAGEERLKKTEHEAALKKLVDEFSLYDPCTEWKVGFIKGFTDSVDREERNVQLRLDRANTVAGWLQTNGVPGAPDGQAAVEGSYDSGCDQDSRTLARRVIVHLDKRPKDELKGCKEQPPIPPKPANETCNDMKTSKWSLQGVGQVSPSLKTGKAFTGVAFMLRAKDETIGFTKATRMIVFGGPGFGASYNIPWLPVSIPLPSQTDFMTTKPKSFEDFNGPGSIRDTGASLIIGYGWMKAYVPPQTEPAILDLSGWQLGVGIGTEWTVGEWQLFGGCF